MIKDVLVDIRTKKFLAILEDGVVSEIQTERIRKKSCWGIYKGKLYVFFQGCNLHLLISDLIKMLICM